MNRVAEEIGTKPSRKWNRWSVLVVGTLLAYFAFFFSQSLGKGFVDSEGQPFSRIFFFVDCILYPDQFVSIWFDKGRLPAQLLDRFFLFAIVVGWIGLSYLIGYSNPWFSRNNAMDWSRWFERTALACLIGLAVLSSMTLLLGMIGRLDRGSLALGILIIGIGVRLVPVGAKTAEATPTQLPSCGIVERALFAGVLSLLVLFQVLGALLPSSEFDVLEYHLQAPKEFYQNGSITFLPHNVYANMSLGCEMHSLAMMVVFGDKGIGGGDGLWLGGIAGKLVIATISLLGAALVGGFAGRKLGDWGGLCAASLWLASPGLARISSVGLIDSALTTYVVATAIAFVTAMESSRLSFANVDWRRIGILSGACASIKYTGIVFGVVPALIVVLYCIAMRRLESSSRPTVGLVASVACGWAVAWFPWLLKNALLAENPIYPLAAQWLGGATMSPAKIEQWGTAHAPQGITKAALSLNDILLTSDFNQPAIISGAVIGCICLFVRQSRPERDFRWECIFFLIWAGWTFLVWAVVSHGVDRFLLPLQGLLVVVAAFGWREFVRSHQRIGRMLLGVGLVFGLLFNSSQFLADNRYFVALNALRFDVGDDTQVPRVCPTLAWVAKNLSPLDSKLLLIGEARVFDYPHPILYATCFDTNPGETGLRRRSREEQITWFSENQLTHVMVHWAEIARYRSSNNYGYSSWPSKSDLEEFVRDGILVPVPWGLESGFADLYRVQSAIDSKTNAVPSAQ
jgi:hypothetical protein